MMWRGEASPSSENGCNQYVHSAVWQLLLDWGNINIEQTQLRDGCTDAGDLISGHGLTETSHVALASPSEVLTSKPQFSESQKRELERWLLSFFFFFFFSFCLLLFSFPDCTSPLTFSSKYSCTLWKSPSG